MSKTPAWQASIKEFYRNPRDYDLSLLPGPVIRAAFRQGSLHRLVVKKAALEKKPIPIDIARTYKD